MSTSADRFWAKVVKGPGCWTWTGFRNSHGYGHASHAPSADGHKVIYAHRVSWELHHGPIPPGLGVLHRCDNPSCVNPEHLFLGTNGDNNTDAANKGRTARGERNTKNKLTVDQVREIRHRRTNQESQRSVAARFGVSRQAIAHIDHRKNWRWLP